jgi:hypothetical protein
VTEQGQDRWYKGAASVLYTYAVVSNFEGFCIDGNFECQFYKFNVGYI